MKLSLVLTINNRTPEVCKQVADSFRAGSSMPDDTTIVLDGCDTVTGAGARTAYGDFPSVKFVTIDRAPGWICPAAAWNVGFGHAEGDYIYAISSEVVQEPENIALARKFADPDAIIFGACHDSSRAPLVNGFPPGLLLDADHPRPLGFIALYPAERLATIGGFDEKFMGGYWYDDDDLHFRLWSGGADFVFTDEIRGTHLAHARPILETIEGQAGVARNAALFAAKHATANAWTNPPHRLVQRWPGKTRWSHI